MPAQDGGWTNDRTDVLEGLPAEAFAQLGESYPLSVGESEPALDLATEDSILGDDVLVSLRQFFVDRP